MKKPKSHPVILSKKEILKILKVISNLKHKTILFLTYSAGLRPIELLNLKIGNWKDVLSNIIGGFE